MVVQNGVGWTHKSSTGPDLWDKHPWTYQLSLLPGQDGECASMLPSHKRDWGILVFTTAFGCFLNLSSELFWPVAYLGSQILTLSSKSTKWMQTTISVSADVALGYMAHGLVGLLAYDVPILKAPSNPTHSVILWFCELQKWKRMGEWTIAAARRCWSCFWT